ncbi:VCBS repeat-containing protein [Flavobacterium sp. ZE23DGlu08]|uniref:VCBS repeat-containing protein n=1 Tax=Flavobacterium sp. ZE23DGlu08 TaxID=3059026 RepID=UPI0026602C86|nr:VCBS repeat-containing protein [Flavobacterium sp. ZE23DGlu08]WKL43797.1 VCBS repeat-containing protein [Flavobacterium sp. ZE23DGlu08]
MKRVWLFIGLSLLVFLPVFSQQTKLFSMLPAEKTGITFNNRLPESPQLNIITYEYFYNGGGVASGDFNNDGLIDLYFTSNLQPNKMYLNKGNLTFEDITKKSGTEGRRGWKTGVSVVDINGDGWLDIYVCYSGDIEPEKRRNQLFINNGPSSSGEITFKDKAVEMGVADEGYSTQSAFFDYDNDGDLDLFVLNHNIKALRNFDASFVKKMVDPDAGDRLYRNDNNHFTDVTVQAGIISNPLGYGLSVIVSDLNNDGWADLYVSNDYVEEDYLYTNNGDGTFTDNLQEQIGHISNFSMGADIADINNDGWPDIYTLDMLPADNKRQKLLYAPDNYELYNNTLNNGFYHQLMRNMLQVNNGNDTFSETGQLSGISNTDWSWSALFADFNNDGNKDLFVSNGYARDMINRDFVKFYASERLKHLRGETEDKMFAMLQGIPSTPLHNYIFENKGNLQFKDSSMDWGLEDENFSHGSVYTDLDNDGDLDLVINRMNQVAAVYKNNAVEMGNGGNYINLELQMPGQNKNALGAKVKVFTPNGTVTLENYPVHGFQSSMQQPMHFGLPSATIDSIAVYWPDGKMEIIKKNLAVNKSIKLLYEKANLTSIVPEVSKKTVFSSATTAIPFRHVEEETNDFKVQPLMTNMLSYSGPHIAKADVNKDGLEDIFIGGSRGQAGQLLLQQANGDFVPSVQKAFEQDIASEDVDALFFDADNDADMDLYVVSGGYAFDENDSALQDRLYINTNGVFEKSLDALPIETKSGSCVKAADVNGDGNLDLFIGSRVIPGKYPETPESMLLINNGKGIFTNRTATLAPALQQIGMITDALWMDINKDGQPELIVCGEWMKVSCFENKKGILTDATSKYFPDSLEGWWNRLAADDLDNDGDLDLVAANWGTNSQIQVSAKEPVTLCYGDFDKNGSIDPFVSCYVQGKSYPMASRDELTDQIVSLRQGFPNYESYSEVTINEILSPDQMQSAKHLKASTFETVWFENKNGVFIKHILPVQANYAPVYAIGIEDYNNDGKADILLGGNIEKTRIKIGKIDANYGVLLTGDGKGNFNYNPQLSSGLNVNGCVKDIISLPYKGKKRVLFSVNNQRPAVYNY